MHRLIVFVVFLFAKAVICAKALIDETLLVNFDRYARFSSAAYSSNCKSPPFGSVVEHYFDDNETSTQGYLFRDNAAKELILSFRGTSDITDLSTDLDQELVPCAPAAPGMSCPDCACFHGLVSTYGSVAGEVKAVIDAALATNPDFNLTVTGHSLGGSLAAIAAADLKGQGNDLVTYTFGQPRTGNAAWADYVDTLFPGTFYRITHTNDGVPQIPPESDGYRHHGSEYWQSTDDAPAVSNVFKCDGQEPADCNQSVPGPGLGNGGIGVNSEHFRYLDVSVASPLEYDVEC